MVWPDERGGAGGGQGGEGEGREKTDSVRPLLRLQRRRLAVGPRQASHGPSSGTLLCPGPGPAGITEADGHRCRASTPSSWPSPWPPRGPEQEMSEIREDQQFCKARAGHQGQGNVFWEVPGMWDPILDASLSCPSQKTGQRRGPQSEHQQVPRGAHLAPGPWWGPGEHPEPGVGLLTGCSQETQPLQKLMVGWS